MIDSTSDLHAGSPSAPSTGQSPAERPPPKRPPAERSSTERSSSEEPTEVRTLDTVVIGAGSGGLTVGAGLARLGRHALVVEAARVGGDCTNVGCIPSKSLLHHSAQPAGKSAAALLETVRAARDTLREEETDEFTALAGFELARGRATLVGDGTVRIATETETIEVRAENVVIATGSRPRVIDVPGLPPERRITNDELFELDDAPGHLAIVGAGPVGVEMALAFRRLGSRVTLLDAAPRILPALLPEASAMVEQSLVSKGIDVRLGRVASNYEAGSNALVVTSVDEGGAAAATEISDVDRVLVAVGRVPNSDDLGLENIGVETDPSGRIEIDAKGRTNVDGVWAIGDVTTEGGTTHDASIWGRRVVKALTAPYAPTGDRPVRVGVTFSEPEAASIGTQPIETRSDVRRLAVHLRSTDRGFTDEADGLIVVDVRRLTGTILGATVVGPRAGELISIFSLAMKNGVSLRSFYGTVWPYPTYADALNHIVDEFMVELVDDIAGQSLRWLRGRLRR